MRPIFTKEAFADWCEKQPAEKEYKYSSNRGCAFCQYLTASGIEFISVGGSFWVNADYNFRPIPDDIRYPLRTRDHTFGALAARLRAA